jgi:methylthioribose-1-phosphate isomerase
MMSLQAIKYDGSHLLILDQLKLPHIEEYIAIRTAQEGWHAIKEMRVRGAPAIAIVAILSLAVELRALLSGDKLSPIADEVGTFILEKLQYLVTSRPTAVNLADAARKFEKIVTAHVHDENATGHSVVTVFFREAEKMLASDLSDNQKIGAYGTQWILERAHRPGQPTVNVLTHCNTG